ncbi:MAG: type IIL restriction-modification enzyme MmeI [Terracidiphilus sp.]
MKSSGYEGHVLELFLVRVLFCLFAEDNAIFERQQFREWIEQRTAEDGSDLGAALGHLFQILDTEPEKRAKNLDEHLAAFRYINGKLFEEVIPLTSLDQKMRDMVLECTSLDWSRISPAIFGALFQSIMDKKARRNLGAHYTPKPTSSKPCSHFFLTRFALSLSAFVATKAA